MAISARVNRVFWNEPIGHAEGGALPHVRGGPVERGPGPGQPAGGQRQPLLGQVGDQVGEALPLGAEQVGRRDAAVGEEQLGRVLGVEAELVEVASPGEPGRVPARPRPG